MAASDGGAKRWRLMRQDDNGNEFEMARYSSRDEAERVAAMYTARGHKQLYWVEAVEAG